jgi:hypothetical protein
MPGAFDAVTCLEMLEHVPDPASIIGLCPLVKPGGQVFFSTLNRNPSPTCSPSSAPNTCCKMLPKGTHDYARSSSPPSLRAGQKGRPRAGRTDRHELQPADQTLRAGPDTERQLPDARHSECLKRFFSTSTAPGRHRARPVAARSNFAAPRKVDRSTAEPLRPLPRRACAACSGRL